MISQWKRLLPSLFSTQRNLFVPEDRLLVEMGRFTLRSFTHVHCIVSVLVYQLNSSVMDILTVLTTLMKAGVILNMIPMLLLPVTTATALCQTVSAPQMERN